MQQACTPPSCGTACSPSSAADAHAADMAACTAQSLLENIKTALLRMLATPEGSAPWAWPMYCAADTAARLLLLRASSEAVHGFHSTCCRAAAGALQAASAPQSEGPEVGMAACLPCFCAALASSMHFCDASPGLYFDTRTHGVSLCLRLYFQCFLLLSVHSRELFDAASPPTAEAPGLHYGRRQPCGLVGDSARGSLQDTLQSRICQAASCCILGLVHAVDWRMPCGGSMPPHEATEVHVIAFGCFLHSRCKHGWWLY